MSQTQSEVGKRCCRNSPMGSQGGDKSRGCPWDSLQLFRENTEQWQCCWLGSILKINPFKPMQLQALAFPHFWRLQEAPLIWDKIQYLGDKIQYLVVKGFWQCRKSWSHTLILLELHPGGRAGTLTVDKELSPARCGMVSLQESLYQKLRKTSFLFQAQIVPQTFWGNSALSMASEFQRRRNPTPGGNLSWERAFSPPPLWIMAHQALF